MQTLIKLAEDRLRAESLDFDLSVPVWLSSILLNDFYYTITLLAICTVSFAVGLLLGWLLTL